MANLAQEQRETNAPSKKKMKKKARKPGVVGLFAGVGGLESGFRKAGFESKMLCEIDEGARKVLKKQFPGTKITKDIRKLSRLPRCDVVTAGFPCQDLSQVGQTKGIRGPNSGLIDHLFVLLDNRRRLACSYDGGGRIEFRPRFDQVEQRLSDFSKIGFLVSAAGLGVERRIICSQKTSIPDGERIRDKIAASRKRGIWMGGSVPLGYCVKGRKLVVETQEAQIVTQIFARFAQLGSATKLARQMLAEGARTRSGKIIDKGGIYKILNNKVYLGLAVHKGTPYPGQHAAIVEQELWDRAHSILQTSPRQRAANTRRQTPALLKGLIFGPDGSAMSPTHTRRGTNMYRYYVSQTVLKQGASGRSAASRISAALVEGQVLKQIQRVLKSPEMIAATWRHSRRRSTQITESEVRSVLKDFDILWDQLFDDQKSRVAKLLVERVDVSTEGFDIRLRTNGLVSVVEELRLSPKDAA